MNSGTGRSPQDNKPAPDSKRAKVFLWVGSATALISLFLGAHQVWILASNRLLHRQQITSLIASAKLQEDAHEYSSAWASLESAAGLASDSRLPKLQEDLAMKWLDDVHLHNGETFSDVIKKIEPALTRGATATTDPVRKADLLAHIGWCSFLRTRDGDFSASPESLYDQAVKIDPKNPYANAMWGHWILWQHGAMDKARARFQAALSSGRERGYVRNLQLSAVFNSHSDEYENEALRVVNEIRKEGGSVDEHSRSSVGNIYEELAHDDSRRSGIIAAYPPAEQIETIRWLNAQSAGDTYKLAMGTYILAVMQEAAGQKEAAKVSYQSVLRSMPTDANELHRLALQGVSRTK
jgi:tetratricopeptide (TPR) repeat protein